MQRSTRLKRIVFILYFALAAALTPAAAADLPGIFDLRNINGYSYIGPVRNQGSCGGCYAFGALAAAESTYNRAMGLVDDEAVDLSESFIIWGFSPYYDGLHGCNGSSIDYEELTGILDYGVVAESVYPYSTTDPGDGNDHLASAGTPFTEWYRIPPNDIETMKRIIYTFGALDAAVEVDAAFDAYSGGIFSNSTQSVEDVLAYTAYTNHAISIVGWNDTGGYWILRNSWGEEWGEDGYMYIDYTSASVALEAAYLVIGDWPGANVDYVNTRNVTAVPYTSGGIVNANAVDIWTGTNSHVTNSGTLTASATATDEMTAARGVYLWGGPDVSFSNTNSGTITATAQSTNGQATAYGISMQGSGGENSGTISATASSDNAQALTYGVLAFNGGSAISLLNSGTISADATGDDGWAYGIWADSRSSVSITNSGTISAYGENANIGLLVSGDGVNRVVNTGSIQTSYDAMEWSIGIACAGLTEIVNTGIIDTGDEWFGMSIYGEDTVWLTLGTGSDLTGYVLLEGEDDTLELIGTGMEDSMFSGVENLMMNGTAWTLSGWWDSAFENISLSQGSILTLTNDIEISQSGTLSGNGTLVTNLTNNGTVSPGNSIGTITITGNYTHASTATMVVEAGGGASDRLVVTGDADIQGGRLVLSAYGYLTAGSYEFITAGTLSGAGFDTVTTPAVFDAAVTGAGASLSLAVTRNPYESLAATANQASLGDVLDRSRPLASGDMADMLNYIDNMAQLASVRSAMDDLGPGFHSAVTTTAVDDALTRTDRIRQHLYETRSGYRSRVQGQNSSQGRYPERYQDLEQSKEAPWQFWAAGTLLDRQYDSTRESPAVRDRLDGMVLGLDRPMGTKVTMGAAGAFSRSDVHDRASAGRVDSFNGYLYSALNLTGFHAQAVAGLGRNQYEADRAVSFFNRTAVSEHRGWQASALLGGGYDWTPGGWTIGPIASLQYLHLDEQDFTEEGAGAADLRLGSATSQAWVATLGFRAVRPVLLEGKQMIIPGIRAEWVHALSKNMETLDAAFPSTGQGFSASPRDQKENAFELDLSVTAVLTPGIRARLLYQHVAQGSGGYTAHQAGAEVKVLF